LVKIKYCSVFFPDREKVDVKVVLNNLGLNITLGSTSSNEYIILALLPTEDSAGVIG
jgi:hypothetical protein